MRFPLRLTLLLAFAYPAAAHADIVMIDVNDQAGERRVVESLAATHGQKAHLRGGESRTEIVRNLEETFAAAERGEIVIESLVLSGHSQTGRDFYGQDKHAQLLFTDMEELREQYPNAFGQIRNVLLMGCFAGTQDDSESWEKLFLNVITVAGFNGVGPSKKPAEEFIEQVLGIAIEKARLAGGAEALAAAFDDDAVTLKGYQSLLEGLESVQKTNWSFRVCGEFHSRIKPAPPKRMEVLMNDTYLACLNGTDACADPRLQEAGLRELKILIEQDEMPRASNPELLRNRLEKIHKLRDYVAFTHAWRTQNGHRLAEVANIVNPYGVRVATSDQFGVMDRREHVAMLETIRDTAWKMPAGPGRETLDELVAQMWSDVRNLNFQP